MRFVDTHLHVGEGVPDALSLGAANQTLLLTCGVDKKTSEEALSLASANSNVRAFVGIHPSEVLKQRSLAWLPKALNEATGLGEVGLDPKYSAIGARSAQVKTFLAQLAEAAKTGKPIEVHSRGAENECLDRLVSFGVSRVLMHWFQSEESLPRVMDSGYFVSFGPSLLYSKRLQRMAAQCTRDQVLTETDFPVGYEPLGKLRGPALVPSVVFRLGEIWGMTFEEARLTIVDNLKRLLGPGEKG